MMEIYFLSLIVVMVNPILGYLEDPATQDQKFEEKVEFIHQ